VPGGHGDAVQEHLAELRSPVICRMGRTSTPGVAMSSRKNEMPRWPALAGIGAGQQDAVLGELGVRRPDLGPVDHVAVAVATAEVVRLVRSEPAPARRRAGTTAARR
jgi:hypothetical protein